MRPLMNATPTSTLTGAPAAFERGWREVGRDAWAWLQPNGAWGEANAGLVAGDGASVLIDTLWDERLAVEMLAAAPNDASAPIATVVNTHSDGDHWWGNGAVPANAEIITSAPSAAAMREEASPQELARMARMTSLAARAPGRVGRLGRYVNQMLAPFDFGPVHPRHPDRSFSDTETLTVGGRELVLIEVGPAHTVGDLVVHLPDASVVFAADVLFVGAMPVMWAGPYEGWLGAIDTLLSLDAAVYVPGHGPPCDVAGVQRFRELMVAINDGARAHHGAGRSPLDATRALLGSAPLAPYRDWQCPERLYITVAAMYRSFDDAGPLSTSPAGRSAIFSAVGRLAHELGSGRS